MSAIEKLKKKLNIIEENSAELEASIEGNLKEFSLPEKGKFEQKIKEGRKTKDNSLGLIK